MNLPSSHNEIICGDARDILPTLPAASVHCCVTSPPYWGLRDYGMENQIGRENSPSAYIAAMMQIFDEIWRILRDDGTLWLNLGDTYLGNKNLAGIPWRVALALQERGWMLRSDIIWHKPNPMPESVKDRPTRAHEYLFLLSKSSIYYYDYAAVREQVRPGNTMPNHSPERVTIRRTVREGVDTNGGGQGSGIISFFLGIRNKRTVWTVPTRPFRDAHFATFPPELIRPCILAGCPAGGTVFDPFFGTGTVGQVCVEEGRSYIGIELNPKYVDMAENRINAARPRGPRHLSIWESLNEKAAAVPSYQEWRREQNTKGGK